MQIKDLTKKIYIAVIVFSVLLSFLALIPRINAENKNKILDFAISYTDLKNTAQEQNISVKEAAGLFKEWGANSVLYKENVVQDLVNDGRVFVTNRQGMKALGYAGNYYFNGNECYILTSDGKLSTRLINHLKYKIGKNKVEVFNFKGQSAIAVNIPLLSLLNTGVGFDGEEIRNIERLGLHTVLMIKNWPLVNDESIKFVFNDLANSADMITAVLFSDKKIPGFPNKLKEIGDEFKNKNLSLGTVEFYNQTGIEKLAKLLNNRVIRLHSVADNELLSISPENLIDRFTLAAKERNIRILYYKMLPVDEQNAKLQLNADVISKTIQKLKAQGFTVESGKKTIPSPYNNIQPGRLLLLLMGIGPIAAFSLILQQIKFNYDIFAFLSFTLGWIILLFVIPALALKLMALASVVVFPVLTIFVLLNRNKLSISRAAIKMIFLTVCSLCGAFIMSGLLSSTEYMVKIDQFTGVKAAYLLPVVLATCLVYLFSGKENPVKKVRSLLEQPLMVKYMVLTLVFLAVGLIYLSRTGNESTVGVSPLEIKIRYLLDRVIGVRPRTKEFLVGHPFMMLLLHLGYSDKKLPLLILGAIGQVSLVNTFAHIHTPFLISILRTFVGLAFGIIIGIALCIFVDYSIKLYKRWTN
ncbi:DUF5693 family protein [Thermovenabulum sp.]|uniref:DUF5693 family protein n=1 Tax=Thermovenabulum sp. TaxID=3100335 RepID=UPI003C7B10EE